MPDLKLLPVRIVLSLQNTEEFDDPGARILQCDAVIDENERKIVGLMPLLGIWGRVGELDSDAFILLADGRIDTSPYRNDNGIATSKDYGRFNLRNVRIDVTEKVSFIWDEGSADEEHYVIKKVEPLTELAFRTRKRDQD